MIGQRTFELVASPVRATTSPATTVDERRAQPAGAPWVIYSHELPGTRKFWSATFGRPFDADIRLTAPDLPVVASAVERGVGMSLLPSYICRQALTDGRLVNLYDVSGLVPADPWFASIRRADSRHPTLLAALAALTEPS